MKRTKPLSVKLEGSEKYQRLLGGPPQTEGMRSGQVNLLPGQEVGEHNTESREEAIIIFQGQAQVSFSNHPPITANADTVIYVPPHTNHNVKNAGTQILKYVYIVSPIPGA